VADYDPLRPVPPPARLLPRSGLGGSISLWPAAVAAWVVLGGTLLMLRDRRR
jgi:hypothetical protein